MFFDRWDFMLGLKWTKEDLDALAEGMRKPSDKKSIDDLDQENSVRGEGSLRFPLSILVRPELVEQLKERVLPSQGGFRGMAHVPTSALSLADVRKEDFLRKMGAIPADDRDLSGRSGDPYSMLEPSRRPSSGFDEGPPRRIGGRK